MIVLYSGDTTDFDNNGVGILTDAIITKTTEELNNLYKESSIYIMTSLEESFGLVLIEAASHGLPIIAYSSALGAKEILRFDDRIEGELIVAGYRSTTFIEEMKLYHFEFLL